MTVGQLCEEMTTAELVEWQALDKLRYEERKKAERMSKKGMRRR